jgi:alpha-glucosidase
MTGPWWQWGTIYQIYPRSFLDTNGDGVGDLRGITAKLDYLKWLGIDAIWISPIFPSPMADFGYDVADYVGIDPTFGTQQDFDELLAEAHRRGLYVLLDLVPNHTSDRHPWFLEARSARDNPKRDFYLWHDGKADGSPPNNWLSVFGGSAWEWDPATEQFYYHAFLKEQPDLNWRNPAVREAIYAAMRFWLDKGVDGFRVDVLWHLIKDAQFRDNPPNPDWRPGMSPHRRLRSTYSADQPETMAIVHEMRALLDEYSERVLIGEIYLPVQRLVAYYGENGRGAHLPFNFQLITLPWNARTIARAIDEYEAALPPRAWPNWVLGNHDRSRIASRAGSEQARVAAMLLLTLRGTPTLYYGDELGMKDGVIPPELEQDPQGKNQPGLGLSRDPERTPMPWTSGAGAGFTSGTPWLPISEEHAARNVEQQAADPDSMLSFYRELLSLRRREAALHAGSYTALRSAEDVICYLREAGGARFLVALNLGEEPSAVATESLGSGSLVLSTSASRCGEKLGARLLLDGNEGVIVKLDTEPRNIVQRLADLTGVTDIGTVLIVAAHPDDDIVSAGGLLLELGPRARVLYVTDGSPADPSWARAAGYERREELAAARRSEALAALAVAGIPETSVHSLGVVDQATADQLLLASTGLESVIRELTPQIVVTHPYEGGHPDHDATALALHGAVRRLEQQGSPAPRIVEFTSYHARDGRHVVSEFLPQSGVAELVFELSPEQRAKKRRMFECHASQTRALEEFGFGVELEKFRLAPRYDFGRLAHDELLYERFMPGMDAERWRRCTLPLLGELGLKP